MSQDHRTQFHTYLKKQSAAGAEALILTCIDYRFFDLIAKMMTEEGLDGKYDQFSLAGASLGAQLDFRPSASLPDPKIFLPRVHWQQVFVEHLNLACQLHPQIRVVYVFEHMDCGAYKTFLGSLPPAEERAQHVHYARMLGSLIQKFQPGLVFYWGLLDAPHGLESRQLDILQCGAEGE
jgi:hypothetical protein